MLLLLLLRMLMCRVGRIFRTWTVSFHFSFLIYTKLLLYRTRLMCYSKIPRFLKLRIIPDLKFFFSGFLARSYSLNIVDIFVHIIGAYVSARPLIQHRIFIRHAQDLILHNEALSQLRVTIGKYLFSRRR